MTAKPKRRVWPGRSYPMGAQFDGFGTNFAVFSGVAEGVELCLFDRRRPATAKAAGLGILLDIVPNHMSIAGTGNR